jgi:hypothetical protein
MVASFAVVAIAFATTIARAQPGASCMVGRRLGPFHTWLFYGSLSDEPKERFNRLSPDQG